VVLALADMLAKPELPAQTRAPKIGQSLQLNKSISQTVQALEGELMRVRPLKDALRQSLEYALRHSAARSLEGCVLEVVGSTSWGGDVPHSDLDVVLLTPASGSSRAQMLVVLRDLQQALKDSRARSKEKSSWQRLELLDTARVPILRLHATGDLHCDVSVDQLHALAHRDFMWSLSNGRPQIRNIIRLVKMWLHRRGLPVASDGGLPSLAWSIIVLRFVQSWSDDTPVATLLCEFFREMQQLTDHALTVRRRRAETGLNKDVESTGSHFEWRSQGGLPIASVDSWIPLVNVEDPTQLGVLSPTLITLPSMPAALAVLYVSELRLAWNSILRGKWHEFWQPAPWAPVQRCLMGKGKLHVVLMHGEVRIGQLRDVNCYVDSLGTDLINRRDQGSKLGLQPYSLHLANGSRGAKAIVYATACNGWISCHPCHLVCALPAGPAMMLFDEGLDLLSEIVKVVGSRSVSPELCKPVLPRKRRSLKNSQRDAPSSTAAASLPFDGGLAYPIQPGLAPKQGQERSQQGQQQQQQQQQQPQPTQAAGGMQFIGLACPLQPGLQIPKLAKASDNTMAAFNVAMRKHAIAAAEATALAITVARAAGKPPSPPPTQPPQAQKAEDSDRYIHCELGDESTCVDSCLTSDSDLESFSTRCTASECASRRKGKRTQVVRNNFAASSAMPSVAKSCSSSVAWKPTLRHMTQLEGVEKPSCAGPKASDSTIKTVQDASVTAALHGFDTSPATTLPTKASSFHIEYKSVDAADVVKKHLKPSRRPPVWKPRLRCTQDTTTCQKPSCEEIIISSTTCQPSCEEVTNSRVQSVSEFEHTPAALQECAKSFSSFSSSTESASCTETLENETDTSVSVHCMSLDNLEAVSKRSFADVVRGVHNS